MGRLLGPLTCEEKGEFEAFVREITSNPRRRSPEIDSVIRHDYTFALEGFSWIPQKYWMDFFRENPMTVSEQNVRSAISETFSGSGRQTLIQRAFYPGLVKKLRKYLPSEFVEELGRSSSEPLGDPYYLYAFASCVTNVANGSVINVLPPEYQGGGSQKARVVLVDPKAAFPDTRKHLKGKYSFLKFR